MLIILLIPLLEKILNQLSQRDIKSPEDSRIPNRLNNINAFQDASIRSLFEDKITPDIIDRAKTEGLVRPYIIDDVDNSGSISTGDRLLIGNRVDGNFQIITLSGDQVERINNEPRDSGIPNF